MVPVQLAPFRWNKQKADVCVGYLRIILLHKGDNIGPIIDILDKIDDSGTLPPIRAFPSRDALRELSWPAIFGLSLFASRSDISSFARAMQSIWLVYFLHSLRFQALGREIWGRTMRSGASFASAIYPQDDLRLGRDIAEELGPVDLVVSQLYFVWMQDRGYPGMGHGMDYDWVVNVSNLCFSVTSTLVHRLTESGQDREEFLSQVRQHSLAADKRLAFILAAVNWKTNSDLQNKIETLNIAFQITPALSGAFVQSLYIASLFGHSTVPLGRFEALPIPTRVAIRPPTEIWPELQRLCIWCGQDSTKALAAFAQASLLNVQISSSCPPPS
ncbi:unnamed protein product [Peniophora sp. CBMAI 1063]|nr:unnamed protein product [Peniophora sp. CBMAI 1063]